MDTAETNSSSVTMAYALTENSRSTKSLTFITLRLVTMRTSQHTFMFWTRISARLAALKSMPTRVNDSVQPPFTKWLRMVGMVSDACRSTSQTACTARHATLWIRTRLLTG